MRKLLCNLLFIFLLLVLSAYSSGSKDEKKNVEITLFLDKDMTEVGQNVFVWSFISGNEQRIWDSVYVAPHSDSVTLRAYTPAGNYFKVIFDKIGPSSLNVYANPGDRVKMRVGSRDRNTVFKKAEEGDFHNDCVESILSKRPDWIKKHEADELENEDSICYYNRKLIEAYKDEIYHAKSPYLAFSGVGMIDMYFEDIVTSDSIRYFKNYVMERYPDDPRAQSDYAHDPSPEGLVQANKIKEINMRRNINENVLRNTKLGNRLKLALRNVDGKVVSLDDLPDTAYMYVDIWASWCGPCRRQFPTIKKVHEKYAGSLTVYAISIDLNHTLWKEAIAKDGTEDFVHVTGANNLREVVPEVRLLGIERIPRNFLLDKQKKIIAVDLTGDELMQRMDSLVGK
ncbi:TlpA family protein disulfide reductase [Caecibacteroides pullorum]|uniref:TlpA family protein disulfide reductase n=1 Tax=Caecibacteroides pullorum TaxID=2725562 RepID=A0AA40ZUX3_9BACT|nr:TlpA disulfide reductase family protein [Caecibacteroides pullorum]MBM6858312.1 TlpA family protein disulfide reductase [Caecibacteroides pullorum]MBV8058289.1 TlpA family protein disulfide reductase [Caecibacteroides pullorum]